MQAMVIDKYGKFPMRLAEIPTPEIGENEVLAEIHATSVNPVDFKIRDGILLIYFHFQSHGSISTPSLPLVLQMFCK